MNQKKLPCFMHEKRQRKPLRLKRIAVDIQRSGSNLLPLKKSCMKEKILTQEQLNLIQSKLTSRDHKRFFAIARCTGQKFGVICNLKVSDVYNEYKHPLANIYFSGIKLNAHDPIVFDKLELALIRHIPERFIYDDWLFSSRILEGRSVTFSASFKWLKVASKKAGLDYSQISTNTIRQSFISHLYELGFSKSLIKEMVGLHKMSDLPIDTSNQPAKICDILENIFA